MTRRIWKYELKVTDLQIISMPSGVDALTVQMQDGQPCLWGIVNPEFPSCEMAIFMVGTGHKFPEDAGNYIGTFQMEGGLLVFHSFIRHLTKEDK